MKAIGIILAGGNSARMRELSNKRAIAAMPVAGSYRSIDFALSNMTNSGIRKVAVLTQYNSRSLHEHLSSSKWWDFGRKQGGLYTFAPTMTTDNSFWYRGTLDAIYQNADFLRECHEPYVIIASGDGVYKLDYNKVLNSHIESGADITIVVRNADDKEDISRFGAVSVDGSGRVVAFEEKSSRTASRLISTGVYVIRRRLLLELCEAAIQNDQYDFVRGVLIQYADTKKIMTYMMDTYWSNIASVESYYKTNMDFLKKDVRDFFFKVHPDVYSKVDDLPPAKYNPNAVVKNSLVASGTIVNGCVENSIIFKKVYVGDNCIIKNSIILNDVHIGDNTYIENCIVEAHGSIQAGQHIVGSPDDIKIVVERKDDRYI